MDRLRAIEVFVTIVDHGSFAAAAEALGLSRNMASRHLADLEAYLGARLLNRTTRSLSLTSTGAAYIERAREILAQLDEADRVAGLQTLTPQGRLALSAPMSFGVHHLAPYLRQYTSANPNVAVDISLNDRTVDLVEEGFDVAIRITARMADSNLIARRIADAEVILCASPDYIATHGAPATPRCLIDHLCLGYTFGHEGNVWSLRDGEGTLEQVRISPAVSANNGDAIEEIAIAGGGLALQPDFIANRDIASGKLVRVLPGWSGGMLSIYALCAGRLYEPLKVRSFMDWIGKLYRPKPPWTVDFEPK
ncbi:MAG: LysR family transcriptional regulator [Anderseniella sp.]|nr:LysR family transcriptional regulator [Anderseniella sp.]